MTASGVGEETSATRPDYPCCTFRGSVSALDAATGEVIWKAYTIPDAPKPRGKSSTGAQLFGPSGAGVWSAPTIDTKRGLIYVATGNGYSDPQQKTSDAQRQAAVGRAGDGRSAHGHDDAAAGDGHVGEVVGGVAVARLPGGGVAVAGAMVRC